MKLNTKKTKCRNDWHIECGCEADEQGIKHFSCEHTGGCNPNKIECGIKHKHNYADCCAACTHGEYPTEGASGHVKTCKRYKPVMKITSTDTTMQKTKKEIYITMFGSNFVNVEKLVPAEDKKVEKILLEALTQREDEIRKEIEGMKLEYPTGLLTIEEVVAYNQAISDILLRLSEGTKK
jgi:hypothetical protein